ncbi:O-antigen ligase family protein [Stieleria varia]|uniref:O-Antigen ligase n=1 Tax=Stieleria varia TaxID=2528005 RepID=A0A5C5ZZY0_9BACT|nr:O-antigen ligase family protein [Stieleria varia]TWT92695.1 O-Antigen ligase [Stieleria varia]
METFQLETRRNGIWRFAVLLILIPIFCTPFRGYQLPGLTVAQIYLGLTVLGIGLVLILDLFTSGRINRPSVLVLSLGIGMILVGLFSAVLHDRGMLGSGEGPQDVRQPLLQILLAVSWLVVTMRCDWSFKLFVAAFLSIGIASFLALTAGWAAAGFSTPYIGFGHHKNELGTSATTVFFLALICCIGQRVTSLRFLSAVLLMGLSLIMVYASDSRSNQVLIIVAAGFYVASRSLESIRGIRTVGFFVLVAGSLAVPHIYLAMESNSSSEGAAIGAQGRSIYNGRNHIWKDILEALPEEPVIGYGKRFAKRYRGVDDFLLDPHNLYLGTLYHTGAIGLLLLLALYFYIWIELTKRWEYSTTAKVCLCFFAGLIVHQSVECSLLHGGHIESLASIPILGLGLASPKSWDDEDDMDEWQSEGDDWAEDDDTLDAASQEFEELGV